MKRPRVRVWQLLILMVLIAGVLGVVRRRIVAVERAEFARLRSDLERAEDRMRWVEAMKTRQYQTAAAARIERSKRDAAKKSLEDFRPLFIDAAK